MKKLLVCGLLVLSATAEKSQEGMPLVGGLLGGSDPFKGKKSNKEDIPVLVEMSEEGMPLVGGLLGGSDPFKGKKLNKEEYSVLVEAPVRRPVKGGGAGGWKNEEIPVLVQVLLEDQMGPAGSGSGDGASYGDGRKKGRGRKNEEIPVLLEAHRNLRRFH